MALDPTSQALPLAVRPSFRAFLRATLLLSALVLCVLFAATLGLDLWRGKPVPSLGGLVSWWGLAVVSVPIALGGLLWLLALPWTCTLTREGVAGRSFVGRRQAIPYEEVGSLWIYANSGFPLLYINSRCRNREIVMYLGGIDRNAVHAALVRLAGPHHLLTREFVPGGEPTGTAQVKLPAKPTRKESP
jgi:hypothetical protein